MTTGTWDRHRGHASDYDVIEQGWNFRMTEVTAALGACGLPAVASQNQARRLALRRYRDALAPEIPIVAGDEPTTAHIAVAVLPRGRRPAVRAALAERQIQSSFHYPPSHQFRAYEHISPRPLPRTDEAAERLVTLPLHPWLSFPEIDEIAAIVRCAALDAR
jgi:dTDP-4-amino-4,6-dideoxygalactose transaminase